MKKQQFFIALIINISFQLCNGMIPCDSYRTNKLKNYIKDNNLFIQKVVDENGITLCTIIKRRHMVTCTKSGIFTTKCRYRKNHGDHYLTECQLPRNFYRLLRE